MSSFINCFPGTSRDPDIDVEKELKTYIVKPGQPLAVHCRFVCALFQFLHVTWEVGKYVVKKTDENFMVMSNGREFVLIIKNICEDMLGIILCNLYLWKSPQNSIKINGTQGFLIHSAKITKLYGGNKFSPSKIYRIGKQYRFEANKHSDRVPEFGEPSETLSFEHTVLDILFARIDYYHFFVEVRRADKYRHVSVKVTDFVITTDPNDTGKFSFDWFGTGLRRFQHYKKYLIIPDVATTTLGLDDNPRLCLVNLLYGTLYRIIIKKCWLGLTSISQTIDIGFRTERLINNFYKEYTTKCYLDKSKFDSKYLLMNTLILGSGEFGNVVLVKKWFEDKYYAGKTVNVTNKMPLFRIRYEMETLACLRHDNIVLAKCVLITQQRVILLMQCLWGGNFTEILQRDIIDEDEMVCYIKQILSALSYMHDLKYVHLDLKFDNIVFAHPNSRQIKIIDFGCVKQYVEKALCMAPYVMGTVPYAAPEMCLSFIITEFCDMWSLGVITYRLMTHAMPKREDLWTASHEDSDIYSGEGSTDRNIECYEGIRNPFPLRNIVDGRPNRLSGERNPCIFNNELLQELSVEARDFVSRLLIFNYSKRMNSDDGLNHPWIKKLRTIIIPEKMVFLKIGNKPVPMKVLDCWHVLVRVMMAVLRFKKSLIQIRRRQKAKGKGKGVGKRTRRS